MAIDKKFWQQALAAQSACNLSGVVISFAEAMRALAAEGLDTDARNTHPISVLFATQVMHLTRADDTYAYSRAYAQALREAGKPE